MSSDDPEALTVAVWKVLEVNGFTADDVGVEVLDVRTVGVMGDSRSYERAMILSFKHEWPIMEVLNLLATEIINRVKGINRVTVKI